MRDSVEITKASAAHIAKWRIKEILDQDKNMPLFKKMAMQSAIAKGGGVDEIADILYELGLKISIDKNNPDHKSWIDGKVVVLEKQ